MNKIAKNAANVDINAPSAKDSFLHWTIRLIIAIKILKEKIKGR